MAPKLRKIKKILIANRAEIALRVIATCRELGIKTVTIYSEGERDLPHVYESDESYCLGQGPLRETYLNQELILDITRKSGADAIHPGYGFLSENANFSSKVAKAGIKFIGPSAESMILMGDKIGSKRKMETLGVPLIPGYHGDEQDEARLLKEATKIGYPVLIKASAGGGGKGMRVVNSSAEFGAELASAKREAMSAFGDDKVLVEKYIQNPRHIEIQVMSDTHSQHFHLFERECSIQRRHQKIIEESPSSALDESLRQEMCDVATKITSSINYEGAGTIEFILDGDQPRSFYFLEMNTRLQVEHPVTEMVTGLDLVAMQIAVAEGQKLALKQSDIKQRGHAFEMRLYAENPDLDFMPSIGKLSRVYFPTRPHTRLDSGYRSGNQVSVDFDPMLAKLIVWGHDRENARERALLALKECAFLGVGTNRDYLARILSHPSFEAGETFTHFVKTHASELEFRPLNEEEQAMLIAARLFSEEQTSMGTSENCRPSVGVWQTLSGFRNA